MNRTHLLGLTFLFSGVLFAGCPELDEVCANGLDDNEDGLIDCADVDTCGASLACRENCNDGVDNNADGDIDCDDASCTQDPVCLPESICDDGADNDQDGSTDCADGDCVPALVCQAEDCENGIDDNGNGDIDCDDAGCFPAAVCQAAEDCDDGEDNDKDGFIDCTDSDCVAALNCQANQCSDGIDNDNDILIDAADPACQSAGATVESNDDQCNDGIDNDFDGFTDSDGNNPDSDCVNSGGQRETNAQQLPDLTIFDDDRCEVFPTPDCQPNVRTVNVTVNDAEFQAGCYLAPGQRTIMEWNSIIANEGNRPLVVGNTSNHQPIWTPVPAFGGQLEFFGWTRSFLRDTNNTVVGAGHKGSFCMIDLFEIFPGSPAIFNNCGNDQGINSGQGDVYSVGLACQFIDITGVPAGDYTLEVQTDFTKQLPESNYNNNSAIYDVILP